MVIIGYEVDKNTSGNIQSMQNIKAGRDVIQMIIDKLEVEYNFELSDSVCKKIAEEFSNNKIFMQKITQSIEQFGEKIFWEMDFLKTPVFKTTINEIMGVFEKQNKKLDMLLIKTKDKIKKMDTLISKTTPSDHESEKKRSSKRKRKGNLRWYLIGASISVSGAALLTGYVLNGKVNDLNNEVNQIRYDYSNSGSDDNFQIYYKRIKIKREEAGKIAEKRNYSYICSVIFGIAGVTSIFFHFSF